MSIFKHAIKGELLSSTFFHLRNASQTHCAPDSKLIWHESRVAETGGYKQMTTLQRTRFVIWKVGSTEVCKLIQFQKKKEWNVLQKSRTKWEKRGWLGYELFMSLHYFFSVEYPPLPCRCDRSVLSWWTDTGNVSPGAGLRRNSPALLAVFSVCPECGGMEISLSPAPARSSLPAAVTFLPWCTIITGDCSSKKVLPLLRCLC